MRTSLFIALDNLVNAEERTLLIARELWLSHPEIGFKINLDYILINGVQEAISRVREAVKCPIFTDIKMFLGQRTMIKITEELVRLKVDYLNIYAQAESALLPVTRITKGTDTRILGITVLTHYDEAYCQRHFRRSLKESVKHFARIAGSGGCNGIILPGTILDEVSDFTNLIKAVPGIRPSWFTDSRHKEEVTPKFAVENGADLLVCGSPVMKSLNPKEALDRILKEIS